MHFFEADNITFNYDGDFDGIVAVSKKQTGREMGVPFDVFKIAVAGWAASLLKERLRRATPDEVLQNKLPVILDFSIGDVFTYKVEAERVHGGEFVVTYMPSNGDAKPYLLISNTAGQSITVDFEAAKSFVSLYVARELERRLCDLTPDRLFQLKP